jgi:hypothetical protein
MKKILAPLAMLAAYIGSAFTNAFATVMPGSGGNMMSTDMRLASFPNDWNDPKQASLNLTGATDEGWDVTMTEQLMSEGYGGVKPDIDGIKADNSVFISALTDGDFGTASAYPDGWAPNMRMGVEFSLLGRMNIALAKSVDVIIFQTRRATAVLADLPGILPNRRLAYARLAT